MTIDICADFVREYDYGRYVTSLFAPRKKRKFLWALYALNGELMQLHQQIRQEKMMGLIRLQWWRDSLVALYQGQQINHPVLQALASVLPEADFWSLDDFDALITAYEEDFRTDNDDKIAVLDRQVQQNRILLHLAIKIFGVTIDDAIVNTIALRYSQAKHALQHKDSIPNIGQFVDYALRDLNAVLRQKIRGIAPLLWRDVALYDWQLIRKNIDGKALPNAELYRLLMAFYLWRKNPFFNINLF